MPAIARTAHPLAPVLVARASAVAQQVWPTVAGEGTVTTEVRHRRARSLYHLTHGTPSAEEATVLREEGYSYLC